MAIDTFTNADNTDLATHNASWVLCMGSSGDGRINTNSLKSGAGSGTAWAYEWTGTGAATTAKNWAQITIVETSGWVGVSLRNNSASHNNYSFIVQNANQWLSVYSGGSWGGFVGQTTDAVSANDIWKASANGSTIKTYKNTGGGWALVGTYTDSTHSTGKFGVAGFSNLAGRGDDFDGGDMDLIAAVSAFTLTGTAAALRQANKIVGGSGDFLRTGTAVTLLNANKIAAGIGAFTLTGTAATLLNANRLAADIGAFTIADVDVALRQANRLVGDEASFTLDAHDAGITVPARRLSVSNAAFTLAGTAVTLTSSGVEADTYRIAVRTGEFAISAPTVIMWPEFALVVDPGVFVFTGTDLTFTSDLGAELIAESAEFILLGEDVTLSASALVVSTVTVGFWSLPFTIPAGAEWRVLAVLDACDNPQLRVNTQFEAGSGSGTLRSR